MTNPAGTPNPGSGWYPDPSGFPVLRWWDGSAWTELTQELPPPGPPGQQGPPGAPRMSYGAYQGSAQAAGNGYSNAAIVLGLIAVVALPIICGPVGLVLAHVARRRGESRAGQASKVALIGMIVGIVLGILVVASLSR